MGMSFVAPESMDSTNRLNEPGTFHLIINKIDPGMRSDGQPDNALAFEADVLGGTVPGCEGKTVKETIFGMDTSKPTDAQSMTVKKLFAFLVATGLAKPSQLGEAIHFNETDAEKKQIVIEFDYSFKKNPVTKKYDIPTGFIGIKFSNIYHVDDPRVKDIPKNIDALKMRKPEEIVSQPSFFDPMIPGKSNAASDATQNRSQFDASNLAKPAMTAASNSSASGEF